MLLVRLVKMSPVRLVKLSQVALIRLVKMSPVALVKISPVRLVLNVLTRHSAPSRQRGRLRAVQAWHF